MSSRSSSNIKNLLIVPVLVIGVVAGLCGSALAAPSVEIYANQAVPVETPSAQAYYDSPLAAGTLTLEDVLEAHRPNPANAPQLPAIGGTPAPTATAPVLTPAAQSSATSLMVSQGMQAVLQKVGAPPSAPPAPPPTSLMPPAPAAPQTAAVTPPPAAPAASVVNGVQYQPGQAPKNLATELAPASVATPAAASAPASGQDKSCDPNVQKWTKTCSEAGYPANYVGEIDGETRTGCADGALHDVWVANSCAPPAPLSGASAKTDGVCGLASNNDFNKTPNVDLCAEGVPSAVSGDGPWTWACSGVNGGEAAACSAQQHVALVDGSCGAANGVPASSAPDDDLCKAGTPSPVHGSGPWTWSCKGRGRGSSESCIAPLLGSAGRINSTSAMPAAEAVAPAAPAAHPMQMLETVSPPPAMSAKTSENRDLCGPAAETLAYEAPDKDLCRAGTPSPVNGDGPWTWSCTDNEGLTSSCRTLSLGSETPEPAPAAATEQPTAPKAAPQMPVAAAATSASTASLETPAPPTPAAIAPAPKAPAPEPVCAQPASKTATVELCSVGKASAVKGSGPWTWTCSSGHKKVSCQMEKAVDAACGISNGAALPSAPSSGLCAAGAASAVTGGGPWTWTCSGSGGGADVSCAATVQEKQGKVDGSCGSSDNTHLSSTPLDGLCASGAPSAVNGNGPWTWSCSGTNGGAVSSCSAMKITPPKAPGPTVNGLCGAANGVVVSAQPTDGLCASGTLSGVVGNGPWNWSCIGENGGMTVSCTAPLQPPAPVDGACGGANGVPTLVKPQSGLCAAGITGTVNGSGPWTWTCSGANGGSPASCIAAVAGKTGSLPSVMTTASAAETSGVAVATAAPTGLVTPHLPSSDAMPSLDKDVLPSLTPSKAFDSVPAPSQVPAATAVAGNSPPDAVPTLPDGTTPLQPPAFSASLPSASVLQESAADHAARIPGNHLTLDPTISTLVFTHGSGNIDDAIIPALDKLVTVMQSNPDIRISLTAYADNAGSTPRDARRLSLTRALAVRSYLSSKGVSESRVDVHAEGANTSTGYIDRVDVKVND